MLRNVFIVGAKRTPFGAFGGSLAKLSATQLGVVSTKAALAQANNLSAELIDQVFFGNVIPSSPDAAYLARHVALQSGCRIDTPSLTLNRLCGSGFETLIQGAAQIQLNLGEIMACGGTESMSGAPLQVFGADVRQGVALGKGLRLGDALWDGLTDAHAKTPMGVTAENLAADYGISREECDQFALRSQQTWEQADKDNVFDLELAPIELPGKKGTTVDFNKDEHPRPGATIEKMASLKPVFNKDGVVTAANASGICDGAGTVILASEQAVQQHGLQPLCRLVGYAVTGCDPTRMGIGPVSAINKALSMAGLTIADMDRIEINEAFAAQFLACAKELNLDMDKCNLHGGAISIGHPLGASGSRITAHLANEYHQLNNNNSKYHLGAACIGGGQGIAVILERV